ncbi:HNH endonuclease [Pseudomonas farris]
MKALFFPRITRCENYEKKPNDEYYSYAHYRNQISIDCQNRCVYCDVNLSEIGHEGFALDHFRPQEKFPALKNDPKNLVISCAKCNRYKSAHWPLDITTGDSHNGAVGFIEPFDFDRHEYFDISETGNFAALQGPSTYLINLLSLNRPSRILVRKKRILQARINLVFDIAERILTEISPMIEDRQITDDVIDKFRQAKTAISAIQTARIEIAKLEANSGP